MTKTDSLVSGRVCIGKRLASIPCNCIDDITFYERQHFAKAYAPSFTVQFSSNVRGLGLIPCSGN